MSVTFSCIAAKTTLEELIPSIPEVWSGYTVTEQSRPLRSFDELYAWCDPRSQYLSGTPPYDAIGLYSIADWSVLIDFSMLFGDEREALVELSSRFGHVIAAATQGTAGFASFGSYAGGKVQREVVSTDGNVETEGSPLPQETGLDIEHFYVDEADSLWRAHGLPTLLDPPEAVSFVGVQLEDKTSDTDFAE